MKLFLLIILFLVIETEGKKIDEQIYSVPKYALLIIDVQYCFINGSLSLSNGPAHQNGFEVIPVINELIETIPFDVFVYSLDWHPSNHISFIDNLHLREKYLLNQNSIHAQVYDTVTYTGPKYHTEQTLWPKHCVENTAEAQLHEDLIQLPSNSHVIYLKKGLDSDLDSYSAFADNNQISLTQLHSQLQLLDVTHIFVSGLAFDYCVGSTAIDAMKLNYKTYLIEDACRGVSDETIQMTLKQLKYSQIEIIQSSQIKSIFYHEQSISYLLKNFTRKNYFLFLIQSLIDYK